MRVSVRNINMRKMDRLLVLLTLACLPLAGCQNGNATSSEPAPLSSVESEVSSVESESSEPASTAMPSISSPTADGFVIGINRDGGLRIDGYQGTATEIIIPGYVEGREVVSIGTCAVKDSIK